MRRLVVAVASASIACGGFLGFGGDDDAPEPAADGGADAGQSLDGDGARDVGEGGTATEICETRTVVLGTDAGIAGPDWSTGVTTTTGGASLVVENGVLVSRSGSGNDAGARPEATLFATRSGDATRIRCVLRVASTSFEANGRLLEYRVEGPKWIGYYGTRVDWSSGIFRTVHQAKDTANVSFERYEPFIPAPAVDVMHDLVAELVLDDAPKFRVTIDGVTKEMQPPPGGTITRTQAVIGTVVLEDPAISHEVSYESVVCEMCVKP